MTRRTYRTAATVLAAFGVLSATPGCAVALGYIIATEIQRSEQAKACRSNLQTINAARLAKGDEAFPDTCSR